MCKMVRKYLKEFLFVLVLTLVGLFLIDYFGDWLIPAPTAETIMSSSMLLVGVLLLLLMFAVPFVFSIIAGKKIQGKNPAGNEALLVPGIAAALAIIILMVIGTVQLFLTPDAVLQEQLNQMSEFGFDFQMGIEEFKSFTAVSVVIGALFMGAVNFGIGVVGGLVGKSLVKK